MPPKRGTLWAPRKPGLVHTRWRPFAAAANEPVPLPFATGPHYTSAHMAVLVECICGRKYQVDPAQVKQFDCETCDRRLIVPTEAVSKRLQQIRERMQQGEPGVRDGAREAAALQNPGALPLLRAAAESGVREAVNTALCGLTDAEGEGRKLVMQWIEEGRLSVSRLASAYRENKHLGGISYLCAMIHQGKMKENQVAEVAQFISEGGTPEALEALKSARARFPNLSPILDDALANLRHLDATAGGIPEEAKRIPGRENTPPETRAAKKGCMKIVIAAFVIAALAAAASRLL